jgi:hypothetical protein
MTGSRRARFLIWSKVTRSPRPLALSLSKGALLLWLLWVPSALHAQTFTQRGFIEGDAWLFPQEALNDPTRAIGDLLAREELFLKPAPWVQFAAGFDLRANSHDQVDDRWRLDLDDRGVKRPRASLRRLNATFSHGPLTIDVGKQFIRWGKADIITPTDRFAPRDYLNVVAPEFLAVTGVRAVVLHGAETFEAVWVPRFTPSRVPLLDQRWTVLPPEATGVPIVDAGSIFPTGAQTGVRWGHAGSGYEYSLSFFNGFNNLPNVGQVGQTGQVGPVGLAEQLGQVGQAGHVEQVALIGPIALVRTYPAIRTYGADAAVPTPWFTIKAEAAYFTSPTAAADVSSQSGDAAAADEYVLYVVQVERQTGEWIIVAGYAGDVTTKRRATFEFAPDRGLARSIVARASYTIDPLRSIAFETAIHQNGHGAFGKVEYSQAHGPHWRATLSGVGIAGRDDDFLGQYHRNSYLSAALRYSF